jgi:hypothetical protein
LQIDSRHLQAKPDLQPFLLGDGPCFPQNLPQDHQHFVVMLTEAQFNDSLTGKDHGGAEFGVAAFKILI